MGKVSCFPITRDGKPTGRYAAKVQAVDAFGKPYQIKREGATEAIAKKKVREAAAEAGRLRPSAEMTVGEMCDAYLARCEARERADSTMRNYRRVAAVDLAPIRHIKVSNLTATHVEEMMAPLEEDGHDKSAINARAFLRAAINKVARKADPKLPNVAELAEPPEYHPVDGVQLTQENLQKTLAAEPHADRRAFFAYLADSGLRPVEARCLMWFELHVREDGCWTKLHDSKTPEGLKPVPMSPAVAEAIFALPKTSEYIWPSTATKKTRGKPLNETTWMNYWRDAQIRADVPVTTLYELRHFFGTMLARKVKRAILARLMRHTDPRTSEKYYVRPYDEDLRAAKEGK